MNKTDSHAGTMQAEVMLQQGLEELGLSDTLLDDGRLMEFVTLLIDWNRVYNLTSVRKPCDIVTRHILDSLSVSSYLDGERILDIGTGAGLPGIPLALANPQCDFVLLDSSSKKLRFVQQAITELGLENISLEHTRIEHYRTVHGFNAVVCRAFSDLRDFHHHAGRLSTEDGRLLAMKGVYPMAEIESLNDKDVIDDVIPLSVPGLGAERHLVRMHAAVN